MSNPVVKIDTRQITDWASFHRCFAEAFGFPDFYGCNLNAWIDCMTSLDSPADGMSTVHAPPGGVVVVELEYVNDFAVRCPEQFAAILEASASGNCACL